jgi:hypothetical protein
VHELLTRNGIEYWLFGGWAVDFYAGTVTRPHDDVDVAVWLADQERIAALLTREGWAHAPEPVEDGGTGYEREGVRLELTFLVRDGDTSAFRSKPARALAGAFGDERGELEGVRARLIALDALKRGKSAPRDEPGEAAKTVRMPLSSTPCRYSADEVQPGISEGDGISLIVEVADVEQPARRPRRARRRSSCESRSGASTCPSLWRAVAASVGCPGSRSRRVDHASRTSATVRARRGLDSSSRFESGGARAGARAIRS